MASGHVNRKIALISFSFQAGSDRNPRLTERVRRGAGLGRNERAAPMLWISAPRGLPMGIPQRRARKSFSDFRALTLGIAAKANALAGAVADIAASVRRQRF